MQKHTERDSRILEVFLIIIVVGLTTLLQQTSGLKMVVLNLYFLPVVLGAFFLGSYRAGVLCLLCIVSASIVTMLDLSAFAVWRSPMVIAMSIAVWASAMGLTSIFVGTLSDERARRMKELNEAYVGVVEVVSRYLQSANENLRASSNRVAELSVSVGRRMGLSAYQLDDIRVAALLHDLEHLEITARVLERAVGSLETEQTETHTFQGTELAQSLGGVLTRAFPLLIRQCDEHELGGGSQSSSVPVGAKILRAVRACDLLLHGHSDFGCGGIVSRAEAVEMLRQECGRGYDPEVLNHLEAALHQQKTRVLA